MTDKINLIKNTFEEFIKPQNVQYQPVVEDLEKDGEVVGCKVLFPIHPSVQFIYVPSELADTVGAMVFPADDAAVVSDLLLSMNEAIKSILPDHKVQVVGVLAPKMVEGQPGINFASDHAEVYNIYEQAIMARAEEYAKARIKAIPDLDLTTQDVSEGGTTD